jgi:hypothetical protein
MKGWCRCPDATKIQLEAKRFPACMCADLEASPLDFQHKEKDEIASCGCGIKVATYCVYRRL